MNYQLLNNDDDFVLNDSNDSNDTVVHYEDENDNYDDGYDSHDEIKFEIIDYDNGQEYTQIYEVPYKPPHSNEKRLICFSIINDEKCDYDKCCTYAHSLEEQMIDSDKKFIYQILLDKNLMNFYSLSNPKTDDLYQQLLFMTHLCKNCNNSKCTGGYNCRHGVNTASLKICRNDLLTGQCSNNIINISVPKGIIEKIKTSENSSPDDLFSSMEQYKGCINGHHLSERQLLPYYKYVHKKENSTKNQYQSVRYIDFNPLPGSFTSDNTYCNSNYNTMYYNNNNNMDETSSISTDEEISTLCHEITNLNHDYLSESSDSEKGI